MPHLTLKEMNELCDYFLMRGHSGEGLSCNPKCELYLATVAIKQLQEDFNRLLRRDTDNLKRLIAVQEEIRLLRDPQPQGCKSSNCEPPWCKNCGEVHENGCGGT